MSNNQNYASTEEVRQHFDVIRNATGDSFNGWDWIKYVAYPVSAGILVNDGNSYRLSKLGLSYLSFMKKSPQLIDELTKL